MYSQAYFIKELTIQVLILLMKVYIRNQQRSIKVNQQKIVKLLRKALQLLELQKAELSILFVNDRTMEMLNRTYRGVDKTTDVLSFPQLSAEDLKSISAIVKTSELLLGDIVINLHRAIKQAIEHGITLNEELKRLTIHGLLHLLGYDHDKNKYQKKKMELKEKELFDALESL
jgi:probable rRNA maturation factor